MILIYSDSPIIDREWIPLIDFGGPYQPIHSISEYISVPADKKIAFTAHRLHVTRDQELQFEHKMQQLKAHSDLVFALESELHEFHWNIWAYSHGSNVYWLQPGTVNDRDDMAQHIVPWQDWLKTTADLYKNFPDTLDRLRPYDRKPRMFDALLGSPKPHRSFVHKSIQEHELGDQIISTYGGKWNNRDFYAQGYFIFEPGTEIIDPLIGTCDWVRYQGQQCHLSQIIPVDVYNETAYSIVAETDADNSLSFFSEKTAKPMIARRLFVVFSGRRFLHNLRKLGFQTFGSVIDESYDEISHAQDRYTAAFEQVKKLCSQDQSTVLEKIRPVLEHNYNHIMNTNWTRSAADQVQAIVSAADIR